MINGYPFYKSLRFKIILGVVSILFCGMGILSYSLYNFHRNQLLETLQVSITNMSNMIAEGLKHAMLENRRDKIQGTIKDISRGEKNEKGEIYQLLVLALDITERRKLEESLELSQRLATIGEMVARVAHEVRNPLQNIGMGISLLRDESANNPDQMEILEDIEAGVRQLNALIIDLLEYSRPISLDYSYRDIDELIMETLFDLRDRRPPTVVVDIKPRYFPLTLKIDGLKIKEVFTNIILNAFEAMPEGGRLEICREEIEASFGERFVCVTFTDNGPGIKEEHKEKVLQPFYTTKPRGTGLGLAICQKNLFAHNGMIEIESQPGISTTISVYLKMEPEMEGSMTSLSDKPVKEFSHQL